MMDNTGLASCLVRIQHGPWRFLQLRGEQFGSVVPDHTDDIDLLGTRASVQELIDAAWTWVQAGDCHLRVSARRECKTELTLYSIDGSQQIRFDLWMELAQFSHGGEVMTFDSCQSQIVFRNSSIGRLPAALEACVYVQHLICKRRNLKSARVRQRLTAYGRQCAECGHPQLSELLSQLLTSEAISQQANQATQSKLTGLLIQERRQPVITDLLRKVHGSLLAGPRHTRMISIMGCDGAGKTTLAENVASRLPGHVRLLTGKHLYRKSLSYKLAVILLRPLITRSREHFDEVLAPLLFLRAAVALRLRLVMASVFPGKSQLTLIDRSLADFLYVHRKTDAPRFSHAQMLAQLVGCRIPVIHCCVQFDQVMRRKQEVTASGHRIYDRNMFQFFTRQTPTDYVAFNNDRALEQAVPSMLHILSSIADAGTLPAMTADLLQRSVQSPRCSRNPCPQLLAWISSGVTPPEA